MKIERYVRFNQHGFYDCGWDGWQFAVAAAVEGPRLGTRFLIEPDCLHRDDRDALLLEPPTDSRDTTGSRAAMTASGKK